MECARLRCRATSAERLKTDLQQARDQHGSLDQHRAQQQAQLQAQAAKIAELELEASLLRERTVEADRLSHELNAARDKIKVMEQRSTLLERERAGAAQQLQEELEAARRKIDAVESRRKRRGDEPLASGGTHRTHASSRTAHSAPPAHHGGGRSSTPERSGAHQRRHRSAHRSRGEPSGEGAPRERYVYSQGGKRPPRKEADLESYGGYSNAGY